jgi:cysteine desulfurase
MKLIYRGSDKLVYLDHAATTAVDPKVFQVMKPFFSQKYGNASESHFLGIQAKKAVEQARLEAADFFGAKPKEIIFTSSATESINLAHKGLIEALLPAGKKLHIITSAIEHKAVLSACHHLEELGWAEVVYLPVDQYGMVKVSDVEAAIRPETVLISLMYVNNEVGTIQPIAEIGKLLGKINAQRAVKNEERIYFHCDATQAVQYLDCKVDFLGVDLLSLTGHKFYAPKGVGALYIREGVPLKRQIDGGSQENNLRASTENVPYIVGLGEALKLASLRKGENSQKLVSLQRQLIEGVLAIPKVRLTGHPEKRAPHIASFVIEDAEGEAMILLLSDHKIIASTGSACTSQSLQPSHVLNAMGIAPELSHGSLRLSLGKDNTQEEIDYVLEVLPKVIERLRLMAPKL